MKPLPLGWYKALIISTNDLIYFNNNDQNFYDRSPIDEEATLKLEKARAARTKKNTSAMDTQDAREGLRPVRPVSMPPMSQGGLRRFQTKPAFR